MSPPTPLPIHEWKRKFPPPPPPPSPSPSQPDTGTEEEEEYLISTDHSLLCLPAINAAFATEAVYWANPIPLPALQQAVDHSLCFGVYRYTPSDHQAVTTQAPQLQQQEQQQEQQRALTQIGFGRLVTDHTTFAYLTDVYMLPEYQGSGMGTWLLECIDEWAAGDGKEYFRRLMLVTVGERAEGYYRRVMGMETMGGQGGRVAMIKKGKGATF
ncbi:hypothetical protein FQN50_007956 [Emmonsiellopsis sp. PD_5]|nr:hypothetical protein FQN50_007956 [Emmonsiellopsis sp. PD_5]